jgi:regulator of protease activity HflC (stomatin/prohibitin superfamily)
LATVEVLARDRFEEEVEYLLEIEKQAKGVLAKADRDAEAIVSDAEKKASEAILEADQGADREIKEYEKESANSLSEHRKELEASLLGTESKIVKVVEDRHDETLRYILKEALGV